ncbi:MAG: hypothetical protein IKU18_00795, partial [Bacteroidales bacterium]|nr:hypothetical protein [Bacteroidales bacterium]
ARLTKICAALCFATFVCLLSCNNLWAQERVYISTDKECYLAGEALWYSAHCIDEQSGSYSSLSNTAYLQFVNADGVAATHKVALNGGKGCGRFQIPLNLPTGNYSIIAYTKHHGGNSKGEFNGKIISIFNTLSTTRINHPAASTGSTAATNAGAGNTSATSAAGSTSAASGSLIAIEAGKQANGVIPVGVKNMGAEKMHLSISIYHYDNLTRMTENGNTVPLLMRKGDFETIDEIDYAGEIITVKVKAKDAGSSTNSSPASDCAGKYVYMSPIGDPDNVHIGQVKEDGTVSFHTGNILGKKDLVFEVLANSKGITRGASSEDLESAYDIEIVEPAYNHIAAPIPPLEVTGAMAEALLERNRRMQISKRFDADTLFNTGKLRDNSFTGNTAPIVYNLDDYTRFANLEETLREYVKFVRVRKIDKHVELKILWETQGRCLALVDGVPVSDHATILGLDQQLVKQIVVYPKRYLLNNFIYDGVVNFITQRGDMGGMTLPKNICVVNFEGAGIPMAYYGDKTSKEGKYPNFLSTIYWNPILEIGGKSEFNFNCHLPQYQGKFKIVIEGRTDSGQEVFITKILF